MSQWSSSSVILLDSLVLLAVLLALTKLVLHRRKPHLAMLKGPRSNNFLFGRSLEVHGAGEEDFATLCDRWISEYGYVFKVPTALGTNRIVIGDPKAVAHIYADDSFGYVRPTSSKAFFRALMGHNLLTADKGEHRRLRRAIAPAFANAALRESMRVFYDSAYKLKAAWNVLFESNEEVIIDVQQWMNKLTLDSSGIAGFGHDFRSLHGQKSPVSEGLDALQEDDSFRVLFMFASVFPQVLELPFRRLKMLKRMKRAFSDVANVFLAKSPEGKESSDTKKDRSILGMLLKARSDNTNFKLLQDEVIGQGLFLFAGYEPIAVGLSWTLVELARHPEKQDKLRRELLQFSGNDLTWDEVVMKTACPYLEAVTLESLRLHPPTEALMRTADKDDVVPLSYPMKTPTGKVVDSIFIPKGTVITIPFVHMQQCEAFWGPDAKQFIPERWLEENSYPSKDFSGFRHLYAFSDGSRICVGRMFSMAQFKVVLSVLIRNFTFELLSGVDTPIGTHRILMPRPKLADEAGCVLRMRVKQASD